MNQKDQSKLGKILVVSIALLFLFGGVNPMSYFTDKPANITAEPGETVSLQYTFYHDCSDWVGPSLNLIQDEQNFGGSDERVWYGRIEQDQSKTFTIDYTVPSTPGTYEVKYRMRAYDGHQTEVGSDIVVFTVEEPVEEPTDDTTDDTTDEDTVTEDPTDRQIENLNVFEKIILLGQLVWNYLFGGTV